MFIFWARFQGIFLHQFHEGGTKFSDSGFTSGSFVDAKNDGEDDGGGVGGEAADQAEKADYQQWVEAKAPD